jgi:hypothetical protein
METFLTFSVIREMQIKIEITYNFSHMRMDKIKQIDSAVSEYLENLKLSFFTCSNRKWYRTFGKGFGSFLRS